MNKTEPTLRRANGSHRPSLRRVGLTSTYYMCVYELRLHHSRMKKKLDLITNEVDYENVSGSKSLYFLKGAKLEGP